MDNYRFNHACKKVRRSACGQRPLLNPGACRAAFTLAEVLITLAVIGVVAALIIPSLVKNHNAKAWATAKDLWHKKLVEVTRRMNVDGVMTGYSSTENYMNTFKKYVKIIKTCDNNNINTCYSPKVVSTGRDGEIEVETAGLKTANDLGLKDFGTRTMSFVIADGTTVIMAYNPNCPEVDPFSPEGLAGQVGCMGMVIDVNGKKGPNRVGKDIQLGEGVAFSTCKQIGNYCWSEDFNVTSIDTTKDEFKKYDTVTARSDNYWAGAKKKCEDIGMQLPTPEQLLDLASNIYVHDAEMKDPEGLYNDISIKDEYKNALTFGYGYWSSKPYPRNTNAVAKRHFHSTWSSYDWNYKGGSGFRAICVKQ